MRQDAGSNRENTKRCLAISGPNWDAAGSRCFVGVLNCTVWAKMNDRQRFETWRLGLPLTDLLNLWQQEGAQIPPNQFDDIYNELKRLARAAIARESANHTLQVTELVNEVYLLLDKQRFSVWDNRLHFFSVISLMMRRVLVDHARKKRRLKRGDPNLRVTLADENALASGPSQDAIAVHESLQELAKLDSRHGLIAELKLFAGFTDEEVGLVIGVSSRTVKRDWRIAKGWLKANLSKNASLDSGDQ